MDTLHPEPAVTIARLERDAEVVRRGYRALDAGDIGLLHQVFDADAAWHTPGRSPMAGDHHGRAAVFAQFARYGGETEGTFRTALQQVLGGDAGHVVALHRARGLRLGRRLDVDCCVAFEVRDGRIVRGREHFFDLHAWDAFWA
jgi:ketosteroid isomerase-like protein